MWMTSTQALGIESLVEAFMRARILGMWPRGGTWNRTCTVKSEGQQYCVLYLISKRRLCSEQAHTGRCHSLQLFTLCVVRVCVDRNYSIGGSHDILHQGKTTEWVGQTSLAELLRTLLVYEAPVKVIKTWIWRHIHEVECSTAYLPKWAVQWRAWGTLHQPLSLLALESKPLQSLQATVGRECVHIISRFIFCQSLGELPQNHPSAQVVRTMQLNWCI